MKTHSAMLPLLMLLLVLLQACSEERQRVSVQLPVDTSGQQPSLTLHALSTKPWLVTGGDVLVEVKAAEDITTVTTDALQITLNGNDVTDRFRFSEDRYLGLLTQLNEGENTLLASHPDSAQPARLLLTNYPASGPIISGPQEQPFYCQTREFILATGEYLGAPQDGNCSVNTRTDYVYWSTESESFVPLDVAEPEPEDLGVITREDGSTLPFIVRVETGTLNRAIYEIAMLHQPGQPEPDPWNRSSGWNGKLVYTHGGGCRGGWFQQGDRTGGVLRKGLFEMGYALTSSTLNVFGQNCNDLLASETHIMVKERFIEHYGPPVYTIGTGGSGGSYQSHQTADNYPGIFDGIIVSSSFPDVTSATIFTLADARLLSYYFTETNPESFNQEQQRAISGFGSWGSIANLARGAARLDPVYDFDTPLEEQGGEVSIDALQVRRYQPGNPDGVRATVYDHTVNVYGTVSDSDVAARPLDNIGVQYGLSALDSGVITAQQFINLNRDIGGFDRDMNHIPQRHRADSGAARRALESGRVLFGGAGLKETPVIDYRSYTDDREDGDIHMIVHQYSTRQRLLDANGHADNHVMNVGGLWGFTSEQPDLGTLFSQMDAWLMAIVSDESETDQAVKVVNAKPESLTDNCWDYSGETRVNIEEPLSYSGNGQCAEIYPVFPTPRQVAGAPLANNIVSCQLKPINADDYQVTFSAEQIQELQQVFPQGVCDWSRPDSHRASYQGSWLSFGPSPVNRVQ